LGLLDKLKDIVGGPKKVVGIDLGSSAIKIAILKDEKGTYVLEEGHVIPIPYDVASVEFLIEKKDFLIELKSIWNTLGLNKYESSLALPGSATMLKRARIDYVPPEQLDDRVRKEIAENFPFKLEEITYDYYVYEADPEKGIDILYIIARRDLIDASLSIFDAIGAYLTSIDSPLISLANVAMLSYPDIESKEGIAILDIGYRNTRLVVVHEGKIVYGRNIPEVGAVIANQRIAELKGVSLLEAEQMKLSGEVEESVFREIASILADSLAKEIGLSIEHFLSFVGGSVLSRVLITGGGANTPYIVEEISARTQLDVEPFSPLNNIKIDSELGKFYIDEMVPRLSIAIGAAINLLED